LQDAGVAGQVLVRVLAPAVARVVEHGSRRLWSAERLVVAHIGPKAAGDRFAFGQHGHAGVLAMHALGRHHVRLDQRWPSIGFADGTFLASSAQSAIVGTSISTPSRA